MFGLFKSLFSKEEKIRIESLSAFTVDMHSHMIPSIDDGVISLDQTIEIVKRYQSFGYKKIITTPHVMAGGYDNKPDTILKGRDDVRNALAKENIDIPFDAAAEYYLDENFTDLIEKKQLLTLKDDYILFELSYLNKPNNLDITIFDLNNQGYRPILAHPERYPFLADKNLDKLQAVKEKGVYFQLNLFSLAGAYGKGAKMIAEKMVELDLVDFVGTDIHKPKQFIFLEKCLQNKFVAQLLESDSLKNKFLL